MSTQTIGIPSNAPAIRLLNEDDLYNALIEKDAKIDGHVFFAITSTGIYCRPICPARRPLRKNVRFFQSPDAAERAGYRACKRCHPRRSGTIRPQAWSSEHASTSKRMRMAMFR